MPLPALTGQPIRVALRRSLGPHLAATHIAGRFILLDRAVLAHPGDFERILIHEIFHFVWVRLGNPKRRAWETLLARECASHSVGELGWSADVIAPSRKGGDFPQAVGELGWSSEWRKKRLRPPDVQARTPAWRRYACESFCDTAAWLYAKLAHHEEFTLRRPARLKRRAWFREYMESHPVSI